MGSHLILLFFIAVSAWAQVNPGEPVQEEAPIFKDIEKPWTVQGVFELPFYSFYLGAPAIHGQAYVPNFAPRLGPRIGYKDFGGIVTFGLPIPASEKHRRGDSTYTNFILNSYWRQNAFDFYFQRFRGFYVSSPFTELSVHKPDVYPQLPDATVLNAGFNWYHVMSPNHYSLKAVFDLSEFQLKSGGSWIYNPYYTHLEMFLGNKFIPGSDVNALTQMPNLSSGRFDTLGCTVGYGYSYVELPFFATGQLAWGPGLQLQRFRRDDGDDHKVLNLAAKLNVNLATGWNHKDYVAGLKVLVDSLWARVQDTQVSSSLISIQLFAGTRF